MRTFPFIAALLGVLLLTASPASANRYDRNQIEDTLDEWIEYAEDAGQQVIETDIDSITTSRTYYFYLEPGTYHAYAEGDGDIEDLDMTVYDDRGRELGSDFMADNFPIVSFHVRNYEEVEIEVSVYAFSGWEDRGEFCFVLACEGWGRDRWDDWDRRDRNRSDRGRDRNRSDWGRDHNRDRHDRWDDDWNDWDDWDSRYWEDDDYRTDWDDDWDSRYDDRDGRAGREYVEERLDDLYDYAYGERMDVVMDDIRRIEDTERYELTLDRGYYVLFAAAGPSIEDLDLHVYDNWGELIAEDIELDGSPAVWFDLVHRTTVEIEVEVWAFEGFDDSDFYCLLLCKD